MSDSDAGPPPKRRVGRPVGTNTTSIAIREGRQSTLSNFIVKPTPAACLDAGAEQPSFADDVPKSGSEPVPENLFAVYQADDAAPSTLSAFRKASGCCPLCNELVGARARTGVPCRRRVLDNAPSSLGLKLRDLCFFPCLGWCGKKPMPCCASKPPPQNTCDDCYWVCTACYVKHSKIFKKPDTSVPTASTSASAVDTVAAPPPPPPILLRENFDAYCPRRKRDAVYDMIDAVTDSARKLCRHGETATQLVQHTVTAKAFRKHFDVQDPHLMRLAEAYTNMTQRHLKSVRWDRQVLLSAVVGPYPDGTSYEEIMRLFGCTRKEVYKARVHAAVYGMGVRPREEVKWKRQRLSVDTVNFLTQCTVDQAYVYRPAQGAGKIAKDKVPQFLRLNTISHLC